MLGLTVADLDTAALSQADVDGLATWLALRARLGNDAADGFMRVLGATVARLAEAESSMIRAGQPDLWLGHSHDELATAKAYREATEFVPRMGTLIDAVHRHHLVSTRTFIEGLLAGRSAGLVCGVGFADLSGFTALTQMLTPAELSAMLTEFGAAVTDVVHADGGRVVKFIGDAVMWVSSTPEQLARAALDLVDHPRAREVGLRVRAGLATARSWPSAATISATPSTWPPAWSPPHHLGRFLLPPRFATPYPTGPQPSNNRCSSRVSTPL
ncbi:adenylate and Guanylate cyclase catalytic domain protein [Mycobacterium xenopi 4042]|uniref:Adenylate and Guanylate cyclase catalytic domain protein n=1 Tax=Mycobacterium xenopi 4042 TaxID=1299334 RepID=X8DDY0_MYCXE|nr:adenylate and Guanylate cyclase catalytic domain protein [Mycobacterium xenopi 4042]